MIYSFKNNSRLRYFGRLLQFMNGCLDNYSLQLQTLGCTNLVNNILSSSEIGATIKGIVKVGDINLSAGNVGIVSSISPFMQSVQNSFFNSLARDSIGQIFDKVKGLCFISKK